MKNMVTVAGVDPGLVDTGIIYLAFDLKRDLIYRGIGVVTRDTPVEVARRVQAFTQGHGLPDHIFIEAYRPRAHYAGDDKMVELVRGIHQALPGSKVLPNTGVKKVVKKAVLELLDCQKFQQSTNHGDLLAAARIALLGMYKNPELNQIIANIVGSHIDGNDWFINYV